MGEVRYMIMDMNLMLDLTYWWNLDCLLLEDEWIVEELEWRLVMKNWMIIFKEW